MDWQDGACLSQDWALYAAWTLQLKTQYRKWQRQNSLSDGNAAQAGILDHEISILPLTPWRDVLQAEVASVKAAMQKRVEEAVAETEAKASGLRDAREKNVHFSARVVALNARVAAQQKDLRNLTAINASLTQELEQMRSHRSRPTEPVPLENGTPLLSNQCLCRRYMPPRMVG